MVYHVGEAGLALAAWRLQDWRLLNLACSAACLVAAAAAAALPESPAWLMAAGRVQQALDVLAWIGRGNGRDMGRGLKMAAGSFSAGQGALEGAALLGGGEWAPAGGEEGPALEAATLLGGGEVEMRAALGGAGSYGVLQQRWGESGRDQWEDGCGGPMGAAAGGSDGGGWDASQGRRSRLALQVQAAAGGMEAGAAAAAAAGVGVSERARQECGQGSREAQRGEAQGGGEGLREAQQTGGGVLISIDAYPLPQPDTQPAVDQPQAALHQGRPGGWPGSKDEAAPAASGAPQPQQHPRPCAAAEQLPGGAPPAVTAAGAAPLGWRSGAAAAGSGGAWEQQNCWRALFAHPRARRHLVTSCGLSFLLATSFYILSLSTERLQVGCGWARVPCGRAGFWVFPPPAGTPWLPPALDLLCHHLPCFFLGAPAGLPVLEFLHHQPIGGAPSDGRCADGRGQRVGASEAQHQSRRSITLLPPTTKTLLTPPPSCSHGGH